MPMPSAPSPARRAALDLLLLVLRDGRPLSEAQPVLAPLAPNDRAAAQRLAVQTLRGLGPANAILGPRLSRAPHVRVQAILSLGVTELAQGTAAHGVVSDCVTLAGAHKTSRGAKGLVNAVLRALADEASAAWAKAPVTRLPKRLRTAVRDAWGETATRAIEVAHAAGAPVDLTARGDSRILADRTGGTLLPTGTVRIEAGRQVSALPGYNSGEFWVQDAAAALPVKLLGDVAGAEVLDMCAAPGGKTLQLAAAGASVTALDISAQRLERVAENLARTGLRATLLAEDGLSHHGRYDAILLDAPCSATGTIRRHPDLPHLLDISKLGDRLALQAALFDHALSLLRPGGRLVFATCSLLPAEGEAQVAGALSRHPALTVLPAAAPWVETGWHSPEGGLRLRPDYWADKGGMDGFYMACLQTPGR
jgi:16S rRNA (cytosine967-C5)-methyltransferase